MKRVVVAAMTSLAAAGVLAPSASADLVNQTVVRCASTATWQVSVGSTSYADVTHPPGDTPGICKTVSAEVEENSNFTVKNRDGIFGGSSPSRLRLVGTLVSGVPAFAGVASDAEGTTHGSVEIAGPGELNATLTAVQSGITWTAEYVPAGSCGTSCYSTSYVLVGASTP
jgi:hypothetical protein